MGKRQNGMLLAVLAPVLAVPAVVVYGGDKPLPKVPPEYNNHHMPDGWWTDPKVFAAGENIYQKGVQVTIKKKGKKPKTKVRKCAKCHGKTGKPKLRGARDFRSAKSINRMSDSYFFWRVSEGVKKTKMKGWKEWLTQEQRWQVIAYVHAYSHGGKPEKHVHDEIQK